MIRTLTLVGFVSPIFIYSPVSSILNNLACSSKAISPISSKNIVPLSASSNNPFLSFSAPVKDPALCPNISLSSNSLLNEEQLTATKFFFDRLLFWCIAWANTSFPVPVSPVNNTGTSVDATFWAKAIASLITRDFPNMESNVYFSPVHFSELWPCLFKRAFSVAFESNGMILLLSSPLVI